MSRKVLLVVGPTGIGKTRFSLEVVKRRPCEIVSADSRQIYKYMDIGTAKPTPEERAAVPHHFIDMKLPDEDYSAGEFGSEARSCIDAIFARDKLPVVVGGSGLYIRGLVDGFTEPRVASQEVKARLKNEVKANGLDTQYARLHELDPVTAGRLHATDSQRILRALEVIELTGRPFSEFLQTEAIPADFEPVFVGLTLPRAELYQRIEVRVDQMLKDGLVDEVRRLQELGYGPELNALRTVGYLEVFEYFRGALNYDEMVALIKQKSRNYAKRQFTWFGRDERVSWLEISSEVDLPIFADQVISKKLSG